LSRANPFIDSSSRSCWNFQRLRARLAYSSLRESYCPPLAPLLRRRRSRATGSPGWRPTRTLFLNCKAKRRRLTRSRCAALGLRTFGRPIASRRHRLSNPLSPSRLPTPSRSVFHFVRGYGPCPACSLGLPPHCRRYSPQLTKPQWTTRGGVKGVGFLQRSSKFLGFSTVPCGLLYGVTGMPSFR